MERYKVIENFIWENCEFKKDDVYILGNDFFHENWGHWVKELYRINKDGYNDGLLLCFKTLDYRLQGNFMAQNVKNLSDNYSLKRKYNGLFYKSYDEEVAK